MRTVTGNAPEVPASRVRGPAGPGRPKGRGVTDTEPGGSAAGRCPGPLTRIKGGAEPVGYRLRDH